MRTKEFSKDVKGVEVLKAHDIQGLILHDSITVYIQFQIRTYSCIGTCKTIAHLSWNWSLTSNQFHITNNYTI